MDAFALQRHVVAEYANYASSFVRIANERLRWRVEEKLATGLLWPEAPQVTSSPPQRTNPTGSLVSWRIL